MMRWNMLSTSRTWNAWVHFYRSYQRMLIVGGKVINRMQHDAIHPEKDSAPLAKWGIELTTQLDETPN